MLDLSRQYDLVNGPILKTPITIIGVGAIGSFATLALAKMGFQDITAIDFDVVNKVNISNQFYRHFDIGLQKVSCLKEIVHSFTGTEIKVHKEKFAPVLFKTGSVAITAVDSKAARREIWGFLKELKYKFIVDPRMGGQEASIFVVRDRDPDDIKDYELSLEGEGHVERCTAKATMFTVLSLSGVVCQIVRDHLTLDNPKYTQLHYDYANYQFEGNIRA